MFEFLQLEFMQRALIAGIVLGFLLSILGVFVVLRKMAFFAEGIAHASLSGIAIGVLASFAPIYGALFMSIIFAVLIYVIERKYKINSDAAIGIIFTAGMSLGVILMSLSRGYQPELISFLFGNILAITNQDIWIISIATLLILSFVFWKIKDLTLFCLNEELSYTSGIRTNVIQLILYIILSVSVVMAIKILGIILASALLIIPIATGKIFAKSFKGLMIQSVILAQIAIILGIFCSYYLDIPTGPTVVLTSTAIFSLALFTNTCRQKLG